MTGNTSERAQHEIAHGKMLAEGDTEAIWGWGTPAGQVRASRRGELVAQAAGLGPGFRQPRYTLNSKKLAHLSVGVSDLGGQGLPETPQQADREFTICLDSLIELVGGNGEKMSSTNTKGGC